MSFIYDNIMKECNSKCKFHKELEKNLPILIMNNTIKLNTRIELLTKKNIRDKLLTYFNLLSTRSLSKTFTLPFSLTDLADYLSVDRSAMMRELSHLKEEGFIEKKGNTFTILSSWVFFIIMFDSKETKVLELQSLDGFLHNLRVSKWICGTLSLSPR